MTSVQLWGVYRGLSLAWSMETHKVIAECDKSSVVSMIKGNMLINSSDATLVGSIQNLLKQEWEVEFHHIYRVANMVADWMASFVNQFPLDLHVIEHMPVNLFEVIRQDIHGVCYPRVVIR